MEGPLGGFIRGLIGPRPGGPPEFASQLKFARKRNKKRKNRKTKHFSIHQLSP